MFRSGWEDWEIHWSPVNSIKHRLEPLEPPVIELLSAQEVSPANNNIRVMRHRYRKYAGHFKKLITSIKWFLRLSFSASFSVKVHISSTRWVKGDTMWRKCRDAVYCCIKAALNWSCICNLHICSHNATVKIIDKIRWHIGLIFRFIFYILITFHFSHERETDHQE